MQGLSFREYILLKHKIELPVLNLEDILDHANEHVPKILQKIKPIKQYETYLKEGYYPFFMEGEEKYPIQLKQTVNHVLDNDLSAIERIDFAAVDKLRKLFSVIAEIAPFKPNILKLSQQVGVSRETLIKYLYLLSKADLLMLLQSKNFGISKMNKPEKIYLNNPNLVHALTDSYANSGMLRETFFYNQLKLDHLIQYTDKGDFLVDKKFTFEVGGMHKTRKQIANIQDSYVLADQIEYAFEKKIPLWLFGFLY